MKKLFSITICFGLLVCTTTRAQEVVYEPQLIILSPSNVLIDSQLVSEMDSISLEMKKLYQDEELMEQLKELLTHEHAGIRDYGKSMLKFYSDIGFNEHATQLTQQFLQYYFQLQFLHPLIYATSDTSDGSKESLQERAKAHAVNYVVNFSRISITSDQGAKKAEIEFQLYDAKKNEFAMEQTTTGDSKNPGKEFSCEEGSITCTINSAFTELLPLVFATVTSRSASVKSDYDVAGKRSAVLVKDYLPKAPDPGLVEIIQKADTSISTEGYYQGFRDSSGKKFIAFFFRHRAYKTKNSASQWKVPPSIAHIAIGVNYQGRWYVAREGNNIFEAESEQKGKEVFFDKLKSWNFFKEGDTALNPDFWETKKFAKVEDVTKNPNYEKYYESIYRQRERVNRGYIGMYKIVANGLRRDKRDLRKQFESEMWDRVFSPYYDGLIKSNPKRIAKYQLKREEYLLIFPESQGVVLNPIVTEDENERGTLRFFVTLADSPKVYEWTYFDSSDSGLINQDYFDMMKHLNTVTAWNYGFATLDDEKFWREYVLAKGSEGYLYLK